MGPQPPPPPPPPTPIKPEVTSSRVRLFRVFDRRWKGTPPPGTFCHLRPDGRTHGRTEACLRRTKRLRDRKRDEERERVRSNLSVSFYRSLFLRLFRPFSLLLLFFNFSYKFLLK